MPSFTNYGSASQANDVDPLPQRLRRIRSSEIFNYILTYNQARRISRSIDAAALADLERRYGEADPAPGYSKYLDVRYWLHAKLRRVHALGLHRPPYRRVLDLGTGTGYFPFLASTLGNSSVALDVGDIPFYDEMIALLGVERHSHTIHAYEPLPALGRFDLVTAFQICFNRRENGEDWGVAEWDFFRRDVGDHLLEPGGRLVLEFNGLPSHEVAKYFAGRGFTVLKSVISGKMSAR
jgi:SAM-dependent methyltransferase